MIYRKVFNHLVVICCIAALSFLIFRNSFSNEFAFDDYLGIVNNADILPQNPYENIWRNDLWGKSLLKIDSHRSFRPFLTSVFRICTYYFGREPFPMRVVSIIAHCISSYLVFVLAMLITKNSLVSFSSCMLFTAHPVHVEAVIAVINMGEPLCAIFYMLGFIVFWVSTASDRPKYNRLAQYFLSLLWIFVVTMSVFFKETGIMLVVVVGLVAMVNIFAFIAESSKDKIFTTAVLNFIWRNYFVLYGVFSILVASFYIIFRKLIASIDLVDLIQSKHSSNGSFLQYFVRILGTIWHVVTKENNSLYLGSSELIRKAENPFTFLTGPERYYSYSYLHSQYFHLLLFPYHLCSEYAFNCIPSIKTIKDMRILYPILLYLCLICLSSYSVYRITLKRHPNTISFEKNKHVNHLSNTSPNQQKETETETEDDNQITISESTKSNTNSQMCSSDFQVTPESILILLILMIVPFLPISGIIRLGTLLAERLLYLPSIGYCILFSVLLRLLCRNEILFSIVTFFIINAYSYRVYIRNPAWKNDKTLYLDAYKTCPDSAKLNLQISKLKMNENNITASKYHLNRAKSIDPDFCDTEYQEALLFIAENNYEDALSSALSNLKCVFTNMHSLEIITKIWEAKVAMAPNNILIHEDIAKKSCENGLTVMGINKYVYTSELALKQEKYEKALELTLKSEKYFKLLSEKELDVNVYDKLRCSLDYNSGKVRFVIMSLNKPLINKKYQREINKTLNYLFDAISSGCSGDNFHSSPKEYAYNSLAAIHSISQMYQNKYEMKRKANHKSMDEIIPFLKEYITASDKMLLSIESTINFVIKYKNILEKVTISQIGEYYKVVISNAIMIGGSCSHLLFTKNLFSDMVKIYSNIFDSLKRGNKYKKSEFSSELSTPSIPCSMYIWYAHALAGEENFTNSPKAILSSIDLLKNALKCDDHSIDTDSKVLARKNLNDLEEYLRIISK